MAVPFSNTSLRVPRGFGNILEGLTREVLRDQPADIPAFAARYFTSLLQKREESGLDPAEWGAQQEDRFYNNNAFRASSSVKQNESPVVGDSAGSKPSGDNLCPPPHISSPKFTTLDASAESLETQSNLLVTKTDDDSGETEPEFSYSGTADIDICAQELNTKKQTRSYFDEENNIAADEIFASGLHPSADVDVCSEEPQSDLLMNEDIEDTGVMTGVTFTRVSESSNPLLVEEETHDVLDEEEEFILTGTKFSDTFTVEEEDEMYPVETKNEHLEVNKPAVIADLSESFEETSIDEDLKVDIQGVKDISPGTEVLNESSSNLEKLEDDNSSADSDIGDIENMTFDNNTTYDVNDEDDSQDQEEMHDKPSDLQESSTPTLDDPVEISKVLAGIDVHQDDTRTSQEDASGLNDSFGTGSLNEVGIKEDYLFQIPEGPSNGPPLEETNDPHEALKQGRSHRPQSEKSDHEHTDMMENHLIHTIPSGNYNLDLLQSESVETDEDDDDGTEMISDDTFHGLPTHGPTAFETEEDTEVIFEEHASDSELDQDYKKSRTQDDISHDDVLEDRDKELDQQEDSSQPQEEEDIMDIPLDDPEANKAAAKIQAGFRGHMTRKKLKPGEKPGEEVSSGGEALHSGHGDAAGGTEGVETEDTSVPEQ